MSPQARETKAKTKGTNIKLKTIYPTNETKHKDLLLNERIRLQMIYLICSYYPMYIYIIKTHITQYQNINNPIKKK